jgi:hypothetical protein
MIHLLILAASRRLPEPTGKGSLIDKLNIYSGPMNEEGMAIELAIRQWARSDATAARRGGQR